MNKTWVIETQNLKVEHRLSGISQCVSAGEQIHLLGANGAGKSTLLAALSGCITYTGTILLNNLNLENYTVQALSTYRAYLTQQASTLPSLKVFQYLTLFIGQKLIPPVIFSEICSDFQLTSLLSKPINQLSGGEWQRIRIVAVFLQVWDQDCLSGKIILFDEPINNLDIIQQGMLDKWVKCFCHCAGTVIMSGHNLSHSYKNASRIWMIKKGAIIYAGEPDDVMTESHLSEVFMADIKLSQSSSEKVWQIINHTN
ncbi:Vitamin B12 import ATP-binding protein BtuD [Providencia alcalifaciens]|uniref:ATP-binding cassette domain-containing protein n=3 Tax=Providencia alcalifaciens TaxID=126385 RepID=A0AAW9VHX2_9GAMM|nr:MULTISPECIES: ATP-binding cassette domain-containing protein [Providencia]ATG17735.1 vitamin B12 ABC transporter ATP-binding protein BtuD [Providencia alcalifaciens]EEB45431.1 ABC transporter, ATP-binding protein [Providencia alcalifaciens DSM 30120]ETT03809.1 ABC transporter, ATP-binding protein [Providencia alcalifaciens F90-2004]EUC97245.1 ABC transporter, ATP-binding protein [Providencia alcalifaciens PAL-2]EUD03798.1 ABC transporter, ATP-binding protein [Providencia alcalifaciens RIMD 